jgi:hypothetical protein
MENLENKLSQKGYWSEEQTLSVKEEFKQQSERCGQLPASSGVGTGVAFKPPFDAIFLGTVLDVGRRK